MTCGYRFDWDTTNPKYLAVTRRAQVVPCMRVPAVSRHQRSGILRLVQAGKCFTAPEASAHVLYGAFHAGFVFRRWHSGRVGQEPGGNEPIGLLRFSSHGKRGRCMTVALIHGVPETSDVWRPLIDALKSHGVSEVVCLSPPGFGAGVPDGWRASPRSYREWLITELESFDGPVDVVGHDWGGAHVMATAMVRPDLLRSWASDVPGLFDVDYVWHPLAQQWQQPGVGESAIDGLLALSVGERADYLAEEGMAPAVAAQVAPGIDPAMGRCILELYRAAAQPAMREAGRTLKDAARRPGLALLPSEDRVVGTDAQRRRAARHAGARTVDLAGHGHWWMTTAPEQAADVLTEFWSSQQ